MQLVKKVGRKRDWCYSFQSTHTYKRQWNWTLPPINQDPVNENTQSLYTVHSWGSRLVQASGHQHNKTQMDTNNRENKDRGGRREIVCIQYLEDAVLIWSTVFHSGDRLSVDLVGRETIESLEPLQEEWRITNDTALQTCGWTLQNGHVLRIKTDKFRLVQVPIYLVSIE